MKKWAHYVLEVLSECRRALQAGSAAITQTRLCVPTAFDSIKYNTGSSNLHVSIQMPDNSSSVVLLWIEVHLDWLFFALQSMLERSRYPFFFWSIEETEAILLTPTSFPWHGQPAVGVSMFIALSGAKPPVPSSRAALSIWWMARTCEEGKWRSNSWATLVLFDFSHDQQQRGGDAGVCGSICPDSRAGKVAFHNGT